MVRIIGYFLPGLPADRLHEEAVDVPAVGALERDALDRRQPQLLPQRGVEVRQLLFVAAVEIGDVEIVEVRRIVDAIGEAIGPLVDVDEVHGAIAGRDRRRLPRREIDAEQLARALVAGLEVQRLAALGPAQSAGNQIDAVGGEASTPRRRDCGASQIFGMRLLRHRAEERDRLAVRRPARRVVAAGVIGNLRQRAAVGVDHPHVGVVSHVERLAGAVGHERDLAAVGRPLRIGVVPVVAGGELRRAARRRRRRPTGASACRRTSRCR